jgi:hypothetical protein
MTRFLRAHWPLVTISLLILTGAVISWQLPVRADSAASYLFGDGNLTSYIRDLYQWALVIGAGLAIIMIMWSGYTYMNAAGDPEEIRTAKDYLWGALLGLVLLILTWTILNTLSGPPGSLAPPTAFPLAPPTAGTTASPSVTPPSVEPDATNDMIRVR